MPPHLHRISTSASNTITSEVEKKLANVEGEEGQGRSRLMPQRKGHAMPHDR